MFVSTVIISKVSAMISHALKKSVFHASLENEEVLATLSPTPTWQKSNRPGPQEGSGQSSRCTRPPHPLRGLTPGQPHDAYLALRGIRVGHT